MGPHSPIRLIAAFAAILMLFVCSILRVDAQEDPLSAIGTADGFASQNSKSGKEKLGKVDPKSGKDVHEDLWTESCYPSAESCRKCHPDHYEQWRASGHAYASVSPMFQRFEQAMTELTEGTVGSFCVRCHSPVATQLGLSRVDSILDAPPVVREGVTCIACHRISEHYGRSNGDRRIEPGDIHAPVGRSGDGVGLRAAIADAANLKLNPHAAASGDAKRTGQDIHRSSYFFAPLKTGDVCTSCHQVAVHPGIWLEVVHAQYRAGPAHAKGIACHKCHMGSMPGKPSGYELGYVAELGGKPYGQPKPRSNHSFWGPGYSIAHPGIFPHNPKAKQFTPREWMTFDHEAGWGTEAFERAVDPSWRFPKPWDTTDDRRDGRKIIDANLQRANQKRAMASATMEAAAHVSPPQFSRQPQVNKPMIISFRVDNMSEGHNLPTGSLGAQPQLWLNAVLIDPLGRRVWESGYLDRNGDLADMHSIEVAKGRLPRDKDLFNLQ
ncbi:MAG: multiheme c-type cytochrome, partial [Planctomycetota bacterium]